jgi:hypothetical protein
MTLEAFLPALSLFTLAAFLAFGVYRLARIRAKQKHAIDTNSDRKFHRDQR